MKRQYVLSIKLMLSLPSREKGRSCKKCGWYTEGRKCQWCGK